MTAAQRARVLQIVETDTTFSAADVRGQRCWVGKCLHCGSRLVVEADGSLAGSATIACGAGELCSPRNIAGGFGNPLRVPILIEHIVPRARG
jgi:hypothetical protein